MDRTMNVDSNDLLAMLVEMLPPTGSGLRTAEIATALGCSVWKARQLLHELKARDLLIETTAQVVSLGGRRTATVEAYKLRQSGEGGGRASG